MLSCEIPSPAVFFDALSAFHNLQQQQYQQQLIHQKPKIIKKIEAEDFYQIQIFKQNGNFNSYEMKVLRNYGNPNLVNLVVESQRDGFRKIFTFSKDDIQIQEIDWQYFKNDNLLVLNVPKKPKFCQEDFITALSNILNLANTQKTLGCTRGERAERNQEEVLKQQFLNKIAARELESERESQKQMQLKWDLERIAAIKREEEEQEALREARRKAEFEEQAKKQAIIDAERRKRIAAVRNRKREEERLRKAKEEQENRERLDATQKYLSALLGGALFSRVENFGTDFGKSEHSNDVESFIQHKDEVTASPEVSTPETLTAEQEDDRESINSDLESIHSDSLETAPHSKDNSLRRHPSMEEVEDEEFVVFRKKFGK